MQPTRYTSATRTYAHDMLRRHNIIIITYRRKVYNRIPCDVCMSSVLYTTRVMILIIIIIFVVVVEALLPYV